MTHFSGVTGQVNGLLNSLLRGGENGKPAEETRAGTEMRGGPDAPAPGKHGEPGRPGSWDNRGPNDPGRQDQGGNNKGPNRSGNQNQGNYDNGQFNGRQTGGPNTPSPNNPGMNTGGPGPQGLADTVNNNLHQLGNSVFSALNSPQTMMRSAYRQPVPSGTPAPNANANAFSNPARGMQAPSAHANPHAYLGGHDTLARADIRAQMAGLLTSPSTIAPQSAARAQGALAGNLGSSTTGAATMANAPNAAPQQRAPGDAALLAQSRPADAATMAQNRPADAAMLARSDAAAMAAAAARNAANAPAPTTAPPPTLANPLANTAALTAAGLTVATVAANPIADARGVILPSNDAAAALRGENMLNPAGHTLDGAQRRGLRNRMSSMPEGKLARLLWAMGALGHTAEGEEAAAQDDARRAMQWMFWILALIAYGCLGAAIVVFVGSDGRLADSMAERNSTAWLAMCGLAAGVIAWGVGRWISRRR